MFDFVQYYEPETVREAQEILENNSKARIIAGGTDILLKIREGKIKNVTLVSLRKTMKLNEIRKLDNGNLLIGSMVSFAKLAKNKIIKKDYSILEVAVSAVGGPQIRNVATIGGNICNGAPSADSAPVLLALNAKLVLESSKDERILNIMDFYKGPSNVDLNTGEILTTIIIPAINGSWGGHYIKYSMRKAMDISTIGCAVVCIVIDNVIQEVRIALGTAAPTPIRCYKAEKLAIGRKYTKDLGAMIGLEVLKEAKPRSSWRASKKFREELIKELTSRAMEKAYIKAGGEFDESNH